MKLRPILASILLVGSLATAPTVIAASSWTQAANLLAGRTNFATTTLTDGHVLVAGGSPGSIVGAEAERYEQASDSWTRVGNLVVGRSGFTLSALSDGRGLAVGGNSATGLQSSVEVYDPTTGSWTTASPMHTARANHSATVLADGRVLVAGGVVAKGGATNEAEIYDPATSVWTRVDSLHNPRYNHTSTLLADGRVLIAGGFTPGSNHSPTKKAEVYDPVADRWDVVGSMTVARGVHAAVLLADGTVLVAGGVISPPNALVVTATSEVFDPAHLDWRTTGSMTMPRRAVDAARLGDGSTLVAGGFGPAALTATAERYDPGTGSWSQTASMSVARAPLLQKLADGRVLAIASIGGLTTTAVETYLP